MRRGLDAFREDADDWRAAVGARAPVYDRLLAAAAAIFDQPAGSLEEAARARVEAAWRERRLSAGYDRPLLLMAALRAEALRAGPRHPLFEAIAATDVRPEAATQEALAGGAGGVRGWQAPSGDLRRGVQRRAQPLRRAPAGPLARSGRRADSGRGRGEHRRPPWLRRSAARCRSRRRSQLAARLYLAGRKRAARAPDRRRRRLPRGRRWTDAAATRDCESGGRSRAARTTRPGCHARDRVARLPDCRP